MNRLLSFMGSWLGSTSLGRWLGRKIDLVLNSFVVKALMKLLRRMVVIAFAVVMIWMIGMFMMEVVGAAVYPLWEKTAGIVTTNSGIVYRSRNDYYSNFTYTYTVEGTQYTSQRIWFFEMFGTSKANLERIVDAYPKGSEIDVWHSPILPNQAVIEGELHLIEWIGYLLLILCVVVPGMLMLSAILAGLWSYDSSPNQ